MIEESDLGELRLRAANEPVCCSLDLRCNLGLVAHLQEVLHDIGGKNHWKSIHIHVIDKLVAVIV